MISHPELIKGALVADALNLGPHWIYDQPVLANAYPDGVHQVTAPLSKYHPDKGPGDFTHYGDNLVLMLQSVSEDGTWNQESFVERWRNFWSKTTSYCDGATKTTLSHLEDPTLAASRSGDLAGASIALSLNALIGNSEEASLIDAVRERTAFSHNDPLTRDVAEFFTRVIGLIRSGNSIADALEGSAKHDYDALDASGELAKAKAALESNDYLKVASDFGLACGTAEALSVVLYFLLRNPTSITVALSENALAGGDNSARAILIALVLTAANGWDASLDGTWVALNQHAELENFLKS